MQTMVATMISSLKSDLGFSDEDLQDLCLTFSQEMSEEIGRLRIAYNAMDLDQLLGISHNIKGVSANMKLTPLFEAAKIMNDGLKINNLTQLEDCLLKMEALLPDLVLGIKDYYAKR